MTAWGVTGQRHGRNTPGLANVAYPPAYTWADRTVRSLGQQVLIPMFAEHPVEMAAAGYGKTVLKRIAFDPLYPAWFAAGGEASRGGLSVEGVSPLARGFPLTAAERGTSWPFSTL